MKTFWGAIGLCLLSMSADAALYAADGGLAVYDDVLNITWLADANLAATNTFGLPRMANTGSYVPGSIRASGRMDWPTTQTWITAMNAASYLGVSDWRLPNTAQPDPSCSFQFPTVPPEGSGYGCTGSEMGHLYNVDGISIYSGHQGPFSNIQGLNYWSTEQARDTNFAWYFRFFDGGEQKFNHKTINEQFAWPVAPGNPFNAVPLPPALWLFGSALGVMGWMRRKTSS